MRKNFFKTVRENTGLLKKLVFAYAGVHFFRKLYPELRRYIRLHEM